MLKVNHIYFHHHHWHEDIDAVFIIVADVEMTKYKNNRGLSLGR